MNILKTLNVRKKKLLIIAAIVVLVAGVCGLILRISHHAKKTAEPGYNQQVLSDALKNKDAKKVQEQQLLKRRQEIANAYQKQPKTQLLLTASTYTTGGDYQKALELYKQYEQQYGLDVATAVNIAEAYRNLNDKSNAISYYQKAIDLIKKNPPANSDKLVAYYQASIKDLQK